MQIGENVGGECDTCYDFTRGPLTATTATATTATTATTSPLRNIPRHPVTIIIMNKTIRVKLWPGGAFHRADATFLNAYSLIFIAKTIWTRELKRAQQPVHSLFITQYGGCVQVLP
jgi:hypothetical protein